jgi:hypothetical protein
MQARQWESIHPENPQPSISTLKLSICKAAEMECSCLNPFCRGGGEKRKLFSEKIDKNLEKEK